MRNLVKFYLLTILSIPTVVNAQEEAEPAGEATEPSSEDTKDTAAKLDGLEQKLKAQDDEIKRIKEREKEKDKKIEEMEAQVEEIQFAGAAAEIENTKETRLLSFWGFFDMTFMKRWYPEPDLSFNNYINEPSSFMMTGVNLYAKSQLTNTFSVLLETRLSFLPRAQTEEYELTFDPDSEYVRRNMTEVNPITTETSILDGLSIERLHMTWEPTDWFNVLAGRYLTPYGIWNIDHGSPVVLTIRVPYMQVRSMMLRSQTGLQIYGRFFPGKLFLDYAVTLSNGYSLTEAVFDLDENKAVGLRLHLSYEGRVIAISGGAYGYYGTRLDKKKVLDYDPTISPSIRVAMVDTYKGKEGVIATDLKIEMFGLLLQGEYLWKRVEYDKPARMDEALVFEGIPQTGGSIYLSNYIGYSIYGLVGYTLPLYKWIAPVTITPYFYAEKNVANDAREYMNIIMYWFGVNVKPKPFLTLKLEYSLMDGYDNVYTDEYLKNLAVQMAVSF